MIPWGNDRNNRDPREKNHVNLYQAYEKPRFIERKKKLANPLGKTETC
jgi:hypothetical protein